MLTGCASGEENRNSLDRLHLAPWSCQMCGMLCLGSCSWSWCESVPRPPFPPKLGTACCFERRLFALAKYSLNLFSLNLFSFPEHLGGILREENSKEVLNEGFIRKVSWMVFINARVKLWGRRNVLSSSNIYRHPDLCFTFKLPMTNKTEFYSSKVTFLGILLWAYWWEIHLKWYYKGTVLPDK